MILLCDEMCNHVFQVLHFPVELAEAAWYLHRATGNPVALEVGYSMVEAIDKISRVPCGFATVSTLGVVMQAWASMQLAFEEFVIVLSLGEILSCICGLVFAFALVATTYFTLWIVVLTH